MQLNCIWQTFNQSPFVTNICMTEPGIDIKFCAAQLHDCPTSWVRVEITFAINKYEYFNKK